jgi:hypothetical protein
VPGWEAGFIAPDPTDPNILYTNGNYGDLARIEIDTWHQQIVNPAVGHSIYRRASSAPLVFSPQDPHTLYWCTQFVMMTKDAGRHFQAISPDLRCTPANNRQRVRRPAAADRPSLRWPSRP